MAKKAEKEEQSKEQTKGYSEGEADRRYAAQAEFHRKGGKYDYRTGEWKMHGQVVGDPAGPMHK